MFQENGAKIIQKMIDEASGSVTVTGNYEIEDTILIPSNFHLILEGCYLRMADGTACNMFRNKNALDKTKTDENIIVEGRGKVILDGGKYNGISEKNSLKDGNPHISVNNTLLFVGVRSFRVTGLHVRNQRWWALNFINCQQGYIANMDFCADATRIDENGNEVWGLIKRSYSGVKIKNADGIDLRLGCRDIIIENITGFTEDDTVALTALPGALEKMYCPDDVCPEISNVIIRNVVSSAYCAIVRLLCQGGVKMYNILVDGVIDTSKDSPYLDRGGNGVRVGDVNPYATPQPTSEDLYNITVKNVYSRACEAALNIAAPEGALSYSDIHAFDGCPREVWVREI